MQSKKTLILLGYNYINAILNLVSSHDIVVLIRKSDIKFFQSVDLESLKVVMGSRLFISDDYKSDIISLLNSGFYSTLITLGWRRLIDVNHFSNMENLINVHPALLPEYKGYHPVPYVLLNREKFHGITAHRITNQMDAGEIILRKEFSINHFSTVLSLQSIVNKEIHEFLNDLLKLIRAGIKELLPNHEDQTKILAPKRKPEDSEVGLTETVEEMFYKVKASDPNRFPAFFIIHGEKVNIRLYRDINADRQSEFDI
jgi:methionyl-tRNA formyltransferase